MFRPFVGWWLFAFWFFCNYRRTKFFCRIFLFSKRFLFSSYMYIYMRISRIFSFFVTFPFLFRYIAVTPILLDTFSRVKSFFMFPLHSSIDDRYISVSIVYVGGSRSGKLCYGRDEFSGSAATGTAELLRRTCDLATATEFVKDT